MNILDHHELTATPFLISMISLQDKKFINSDYCSTTISPAAIRNATGNSSTIKKNSAVLAAFGEYNERLNLFYNLCTEIPMLTGFSLFDDTQIKVNPATVYMDFSLKGLRNHKKSFTDSCGLASHVSSDLALYSAIGEFIERQSLIATWLGKRSGKEYEAKALSSDFKMNNVLNRFTDIFEYFKLYDISIFPGVYVLLLLGINDTDFSIGISASCSFSDAFCGALDEFQQSYESILLFHNSDQKRKQDRYKEGFLNQSPWELRDKYLFLEASKKVELNKEKFEISDGDQLTAMKHNLASIGLKCYAVSIIPSIGPNLRIVKVMSPDAFPHMNTEILEPSEYKITNLIRMNEFPNIGKQLPFP